MEFEDIIPIILKLEGGYVNNPRDPGGETNFGITKKYYPDVDIKGLTAEKASLIYKKDFWDKYQLEQFPKKLRLIILDCMINQGPQAAIGLLQAALGVKCDGDLGPATLAAVQACNVEKCLVNYAQKRLARYQMNPKYNFFGDGWNKRLLEISILSAQATGEA